MVKLFKVVTLNYYERSVEDPYLSFINPKEGVAFVTQLPDYYELHMVTGDILIVKDLPKEIELEEK